MGVTASQIRQDFSCFGGFGQQGYGYNTEQLRSEFAKILALDKLKTAILIGAGNLGRAVASQMSFEDKGFKLIGIFDCDPLFKGMKIRNMPILGDNELESFCIKTKPDMAVLCLPEEKAPDIVDKLISFGISGFWNFSHYDIHRKYPDVKTENVHLSDSLMTLSYIMNENNAEEYE